MGLDLARSLGVAAASVVLLAVWIRYELRSVEPLVNLRQVRNRSVLTADASGFLIAIALYCHRPATPIPSVRRGTSKW
jgi:hypothetical protein